MRPIPLPISEFLAMAISAARELSDRAMEAVQDPRQAAGRRGKAYDGIAVILDRTAERRSTLLESIVGNVHSFDDLTGKEILLIVPSPDGAQAPAQEWVLNPRRSHEGVGAGGLYVVNHDDDFASALWELVPPGIEGLAAHPKRLERAITRSVSEVRDFLELAEATDVPSLVLLCLRERDVFVFQYGVGDDAYVFFKQVVGRKPKPSRAPWLSQAVAATAANLGLVPLEPIAFESAIFAGWHGHRYAAQGTEPVRMTKGGR